MTLPVRSMTSLGIAAGLTVASFAVGSAQGGTIRHDRDPALYTALAAHPDFAATGFLRGLEGTSNMTCSATLISPTWVLTAAHCVDGSNITNLRFGLGPDIDGPTVQAVEWFAHENWTGALDAGWDIGLVRLAEPITSVAPAMLFTGDDERGLVGTHVGYGVGGTGLTGATGAIGTKRAGNNMGAACGGDVTTTGTGGSLSLAGISPRLMFDDFDNPDNPADSGMGDSTPLNLEYLVAGGDSGGGYYVEFNGEVYLAGVHSFIAAWNDASGNADYGDLAASTRVSEFNAWINSFIPEPASLSALLLPGLLLLRRRPG